MSDIMDIIKTRRSVRKYEERDVPEGLLEKVLEAAQWAQSWANTQCWEIVVIKDPAMKAKVQETMPKGNPSRDAIVAAPVLLALCAKLKCSGYYKGAAPTKFGDFTMFGPAVQIYTATHPMNAELRRTQEFAKTIEIGSDVWVGGGAIICPGVKIGSKSVIGAGSVVTRDIPANVFAAGNPCRVIRDITD